MLHWSIFNILKSYVFCSIYINEDDQVSYGKRNIHWKGEPRNCFQNMDNGKLRDYSAMLIKEDMRIPREIQEGLCNR